MARLGLEKEIVDKGVYQRTVARFKDARIALPTFAELAEPSTIPGAIREALAGVGPDDAHPLNLFRVHWNNAADRRSTVDTPGHVVLPESLTGVSSPIIVALGNRFPMIGAHKVLAAYACLVPRLVTGQFDPTAHKAVWPSTGNYCRGGVAISRILGCHGIAVLPEGMSDERFAWLSRWAADPADIIRTTGTESNVKEIYDKCHELDLRPDHVIFNQFCEFGNHLAHYRATGLALERAFEAVERTHPGLRLAAFTSATGSAGTIGAGDYLKDRHGTRIVAVEAIECPTMLENGFGEHNIQGIGDKHIPFIHNVMNTDLVAAISDRSTDALNVVFNTPPGRAHLAARGVPADTITALGHMGLSGICNVLAAIKTAKQLGLGPHDAIVTIATDGSEMYKSEIDKAQKKLFAGTFGDREAAAAVAQHLDGASTDHLLELDTTGRKRIFNLGYFTWVEQQGVSVAEFTARRDQGFWRGLRSLLPEWDELIRRFNHDSGARGSA